MNRYAKQNELLKESWELKEYSYDLEYEKSKRIREEQDKVWKQFIFYKELNKAMDNNYGNKRKARTR